MVRKMTSRDREQIFELNQINKDTSRPHKCTECGDDYPEGVHTVTKGYCLSCYQEIEFETFPKATRAGARRRY